MKVMLDIPYRSQLDIPDADYSLNDCGPTCLAMMIAKKGMNDTVDDVYENANITKKGALSVSEVRDAGNIPPYKLGLQRHDSSHHISLDNMHGWINEGRPIIVLIDYQPVMDAGYHENPISGSNKGHFVLVVGYDDNNIYVHDPYFRDEGGKNRQWRNSVFSNAWFDHQPQYYRTSLVPDPPLGQPIYDTGGVSPKLYKLVRTKALYLGIDVPTFPNDAAAQEWVGEWGTHIQEYIVARGDTLCAISEHVYGTPQHYMVIAVFNDIANPNMIQIGQQLQIPLPGAGIGLGPRQPVSVHLFTNQQVINAFYYIYRDRDRIDDYWDAITLAGLSYIVEDRGGSYKGPNISDLPNLSDDIKAAIQEKLDEIVVIQ